MHHPRAAFTLIELLVVIAIIAVLSVVVVLSLNPAELLRQSRDSNRLSDLATLNSALGLYTTDQAGASGFSLGNASSVYVSLPDSSSTCGTWALPTPPSGYTYACSTSTSSRNINSSGWVPVNFSLMSSGSPFGQLPIDPTDQSSTGLYYTYYSNGSQFVVTAVPESQKQKIAFGSKSAITNYPDVLANGSNLIISPLFNVSGLVGYWPMDEGTGSTTIDLSGNNNNENWLGSAIGNSGSYYAQGKVGNYAGYFDGVGDKATSINSISWGPNGSVSMWINPSAAQIATSNWTNFALMGGGNYGFIWQPTSAKPYLQFCPGCSSALGTPMAANTWYFLVGTWSQISGSSSTMAFYQNGSLTNSATGPSPANSNPFYLSPGNGGYFSGLIDDVRVYNRALSPAEIQAIYNAER